MGDDDVTTVRETERSKPSPITDPGRRTELLVTVLGGLGLHVLGTAVLVLFSASSGLSAWVLLSPGWRGLFWAAAVVAIAFAAADRTPRARAGWAVLAAAAISLGCGIVEMVSWGYGPLGLVRIIPDTIGFTVCALLASLVAVGLGPS